MTAAHNLDWDEFIQSHDYWYGVIIRDYAVGDNVRDAAKEIHIGYSSAIALKNKMALELREFLGDEAVADACRVPLWKAGIHAEREKSACRHH